MQKALLYMVLIFIWILPNKTIFTSAITGKVVDIYTHTPIIGATINIPGTEYKTTTSQNGYFSFIISGESESDDYFYIAGIENLLIWQTKNPLTLDISVFSVRKFI